MINRQSGDFYRLHKLAYQDKYLFFKTAFLGIFILLCFGASSIITANHLFVDKFSLPLFITVIACLILGLSCLIIFYLISSHRDFIIWNIIFSISFFPIILWTVGLSWLSLIIFSIFLFGFFIGGGLSKLESNIYIKPNWLKIINRGSTFILLGLIVLSFFIIVNNPFISRWRKSLMNPGEQLSLQFPILNLNINETVDDFLKSYLQITAPENILNIRGAENLLLEQIKTNLSESLNIEIIGEENFIEFITNFAINQWNNFNNLIRISLIITFLLLIFSFVKFIKTLILIILLPVFWLVLQFLIGIKYLKIEKVGIEKKVLKIA